MLRGGYKTKDEHIVQICNKFSLLSHPNIPNVLRAEKSEVLRNDYWITKVETRCRRAQRGPKLGVHHAFTPAGVNLPVQAVLARGRNTGGTGAVDGRIRSRSSHRRGNHSNSNIRMVVGAVMHHRGGRRWFAMALGRCNAMLMMGCAGRRSH